MSCIGPILQKILLIKTSSLGDVIHNLPVVSDLQRHFPGIEVDWVVEEGFAAIPRLHPGVSRVIPVAVRRWRKKLFRLNTWREISRCRSELGSTDYDFVLDTQGLFKSALIARQANGVHLGYGADAAREAIAARFYDAHFFVPKTLHAVERNRRLAAAAFGYSISPELDYGITFPRSGEVTKSLVFLTATSRDDKLWPEDHWVDLGQHLGGQGFNILLPSGSAVERERATRIAARVPGAQVLPPLDLTALSHTLGNACAVIGVDTGLSHLAAALGTPVVALYTATDPGLTGVLGGQWFRNMGGKGQIPSVSAVLETLKPVLPFQG